MKSLKNRNVLISGASIAGLSTAYWMNKSGYRVTVVEVASEPRVGGTPVDVRGTTVETVKRMGIFEQLTSNRLQLEKMEFKNADDVTIRSILLQYIVPNNDIEVERVKFISILFDILKTDVEFIFSNSIAALRETEDTMRVTFKNGLTRTFDLVFGCDGIHSGVRDNWFGHEREYVHFLEAYFSITTVNKSLIQTNTAQRYNVPGKAIMLNAYNHKTDIVFCFFSENEISYDYRDEAQQRKIITERFTGEHWRTAELLDEVRQAKTFYFDKFCQIKMPSWTKGRVALVGDAAYCASPAAGMGAALAMAGAEALSNALQKYDGDFELAFQEYNIEFRPFIEKIQATAEFNARENFIPRTDEAIRKRNEQRAPF